VAHHPSYEIVVVGGGPAGAAVSRLLASWGHATLTLDHAPDRSHGLAESLPPSTRKILRQLGVLDAVERGGFYRATGNTVWWASADPRVESFGEDAHAAGYQVHRPDFDRVLRDSARDAGAVMCADARVHDVRLDEGQAASVVYEHEGRRHTASCRFVLDCSGRAGVIGRRFRRTGTGHGTLALVGVWRTRCGWNLADETHTVVESHDEGWTWSVPISSTTRHVGAMLDRTRRRQADECALASAYRAEIGRSVEMRRVLQHASLENVWACDASVYSASTYAGPQFLLVGDAGSFIDPLSSFGVKKALTSAWMAAIAVHTCLVDSTRQSMALDFFSNWEREVYATHQRRSRDFARDASAGHPYPFWTTRASLAVDDEARADGADTTLDRAALEAFERLRQASSIRLAFADRTRLEPRPIIRGREIVLEDALVARADPVAGGAPALRFFDHVDLVKLAELACRHSDVPDLFADYCRTCAPVPLPSLVSGLYMLVAKGILHELA
jgi:flavin-dependent dehydrogenase